MKHFFDGYPSTAHPDGDSLVDGVLALELLPRGARRAKHRAARHHHRAPALQGAHDRGLLVQEVDRPAVRLPAELALVLRQLPQHDVLGPGRAVQIDEEAVRTLNLLLILHADHEQNCSTSTVRLVGSSQANLFASIAAGICALWGPLHGGANQEVVEMLEKIQADGGDVKKFVDAGEGQEIAVSPDGLRPPRLQELRSAREDHQGRLRSHPRSPRHQGFAARHRHAARGSGAQGSLISSSESSTRTSTSTAASSTARSASPRTCSR